MHDFECRKNVDRGHTNIYTEVTKADKISTPSEYTEDEKMCTHYTEVTTTKAAVNENLREKKRYREPATLCVYGKMVHSWKFSMNFFGD